MIDDVLLEAEEKMDKAVDHARADFASVRTGRASPALVEKLPVDYYDADVPLQQLAGFTVQEGRTLVIQPYDKTSIKAIEKALMQSDLGLTPSNDGAVIRLNFPPLTGERRKELVKVVKGKAEDARVSIRNLRRAARHDLDKLEKGGEISADELERAEKELEKLTHTYVDQVDKALDQKQAELLEV